MSSSHPKVFPDNPGAIQFWIWATMKITAMVVGVVTGIVIVSQIVFQRELQEFHREAVPKIESLIDEKLHVERAIAAKDVSDQVHALERSVDIQVGEMKALQVQISNNSSKLTSIEAKLDKLLKNGGH